MEQFFSIISANIDLIKSLELIKFLENDDTNSAILVCRDYINNNNNWIVDNRITDNSRLNSIIFLMEVQRQYETYGSTDIQLVTQLINFHRNILVTLLSGKESINELVLI